MSRFFPLMIAGIAALFAASCQHFESGNRAPVTIVMIGDSTMAVKKADRRPETGWSEALPLLFDDSVTIRNLAVNGRSTKSFIDEGRWDAALELLKPGDYLVVEFGHNDEKSQDPSRYTDPWGGYTDNLKRFALEARAKGAHPILLSPISRRKFDGEGSLQDTHGDYPEAARALAEELEIPFVDMEQRTAELLQEMGPQKSVSLFLHLEPGESPNYPDGKTDDTHLNAEGARVHAGLFTEGLLELDHPLADRLR